jgi:hypothetical protein
MGAKWQKNEATAVKRRCDLIISKNDNTLAPRSSDFIALGYVFICGVNSPNYDLAVGTLTNKRRALATTSGAFTADHTTESFTKAAHGLETGDGPFWLGTTIGLPVGFATSTNYWIIYVDANTFQLAASLADAYAGTEITFADNGVGVHTITGSLPTRGIDGHFTYQATQGETGHDAPETSVIVDGTDYEIADGFGAYTTVEMDSANADWGAVDIEAGVTRDDAMRLSLRERAAKFSIVGSVIQFRDLADTKDSHHGTVTASGRTAAGIDDAT